MAAPSSHKPEQAVLPHQAFQSVGDSIERGSAPSPCAPKSVGFSRSFITQANCTRLIPTGLARRR